MKKIFFTFLAVSIGLLAMAQTDVYHDGTEAGHNYVDLGLTSGTKWATMNIGASKAQDYGNYYAWGEVAPKSIYDWNTYKYINTKLTKYNTDSRYGKDGFTDNKATLDPVDDAAYVKWGGKWRMPTGVQQEELRKQCYWEWTENYNNSGVKGYVIYRAKAEDDKGVKRIKGVIRSLSSYSYTLSDAHIFLPAAGSRANDGSYYVGSYGHYWSLSLRTDKPDHSHDMFFKDDDGVDSNGDGLDFHRCLGQSVRAVIPGE